MKHLQEITLSSQKIYEGRILNLRLDQVLLPDGKQSSREVVEFSEAVTIVAVTPEQNVLLVYQYRYPVADVLLEAPAGKKDPGESPEVCARRELQEETGYTAGTLEKICQFYTTPGFTNELMHVFLARDLTPGQQKPDEDEFVQVTEVALQDALEMIYNGQIRDGKTIAGLLAAYNLLQKNNLAE
ncbi:NUDIX hydrolase [Desulfotomaculum varum]